MSITLAGQTLPDPNNYQVELGYRGSGVTMASGAVKFDLTSGTVKNKFTLTWKALTAADRALLLAAWAAMKTASVTFDNYYYDAGPPEVGRYTVTRDPASPNLNLVDLKTGTGVRWSVTIILIEV